MYVLVSLLVVTLFVGALVDIIMSEQGHIKHLPKFLWIIIVILMPLIGSVLWFAIGREYARPADRGGFGDPRRREQPTPAVGDSLPGNSLSRNSLPGSSMLGYSGRDDSGLSKTERELAALEREIAASEKADRIRRLEDELRARREIENPGD
jgi:hypothetical protein